MLSCYTPTVLAPNLMDFTLYWFMFPVALCVATMAMLSGIGGTAFFMPIFLLLFPLLGTEYPLNDPVTAVAAALMTSTFGFLSGFIGYQKRKLIDYQQSKRILWLTLPAALLGVLLAHLISPIVLRSLYGLLLLALSYIMIKGFTWSKQNTFQKMQPRTITSNTGETFNYNLYTPRKAVTLLGATITGMLATGVGEVIIPQLVKDGKIPYPVAAATSVVAVMATMLIASSAHVLTLIHNGGFDAIPWNLVCYTIPGVILGGQLGPRIQGKIATSTLSRFMAVVFVVIGICMLWTVYHTIDNIN